MSDKRFAIIHLNSGQDIHVKGSAVEVRDALDQHHKGDWITFEHALHLPDDDDEGNVFVMPTQVAAVSDAAP